MRYLHPIFIALILVTTARAQDKELIDALQKLDTSPLVGDKARFNSIRSLRDEVNKADLEAWRRIADKADWERFRDERLARLRASLGKFPPPPKQVKVVTTMKIAADGCTIECLIYESRPGFYVTANLYVPKEGARMPGFIIVHSHHNPKTQSELQDMGMLWARQGCLVLIPDMVGHGERRNHPFVNADSYPEKYEVGRQDYRFRYNSNLQLTLVGECLMGWMVWDLMRGVDVLQQQPNLDHSKIMVFGSVAGGGDPCAVFAALDKRIAAAAPFNFGGPQPETPKLGQDAELAFNYMGGGSWESTRNLRLSGRDGFLPWLIVGSLAPRGLIYGHEFAWDDERDPVWARFNKLWGEFYGARDKLASAKGKGSVTTSSKSGSTHCNNIGAVHRKPMYPTLNKWFGLPIPEENKAVFKSSELQCWTEEARKTLKPKRVEQLAAEMAAKAKPAEGEKRKDHWFELLGASIAPKKAGTFGSLEGPLHGNHRVRWFTIRYADTVIPTMLLLPDKHVKGSTPVVIGLAQQGKAGFLKHRGETIARLLEDGIAVCLPDLRGAGETGSNERGRQSSATSYSASLQMHGRTVPGVQLQELAMLMDVLGRQFGSIALWGDSFAPANDPKMVFAKPYDVANMPKQSEPMGGTLALLGGMIGGDRVKAIYVHGGLISFRSLLDSPFCYVPHDAVIPGVLLAGDLTALAEANRSRGLRLEALVDGLNRRVDEKALKAAYKGAAFSRPAHDLMVLRAEASAPAEVARWIKARLQK